MNVTEKLRTLPAVNEVLENLPESLGRFPRALVAQAVRGAIEDMRCDLLAGKESGVPLQQRISRVLDLLEQPSLRHVINATGVVLHTNLGRAPLGPLPVLSGYSNLEYDLAEGRRGKRDTHAASLIQRLTGAPGIAVNNNAAAVFLALHELAAGGEAVVSRGELVEIGDGFRIPDIMARSGAILREVGTTNRTTINDYRAAIHERTRLLLRVHPSNFRITGFTSRVELAELAALGREKGVPVYEDLGSGCVVDLRLYGIVEPRVADSISAGADLISFSGDKLLGGPQAGILAGRADIIARLRRNPLFRALRLDKVMYQALETTLRNLLLERWERVPVIAMIRQPAEEIRMRSEALLSQTPDLSADVIEGESVIGGGTTPEQSIPTWLIALKNADAVRAERRLRANDPAVVARIEKDRLVFDLRTVFPEEEPALVEALRRINV